jgi:hypothetical protein
MKNLWTAVLLMIAIQFGATQDIAEIYKWVDQNGVTHFSDVPPTSGQKLETMKTPAYREPSPDPALSNPEIENKPTLNKIPTKNGFQKLKSEKRHTNTVEIYTTSWCG